MDFLYTIDPNADEPIMLIDSHIGKDEIDGEGIMGDKFSKELLFLDTMNKSRIKIWINSPGGVVTDGQQIFGTILKTKTKVDTYCVGIAASIALPILFAGRSVYMMDYSRAMMHPVSGGDQKTREALESSVVSMLSTRSSISEDVVKKLMARTTWITARECEELGICKVEDSSTMNVPRVVSNDWKDYKLVTNKLVNDNKPQISNQMKKVTNKLGLVDAANEDSIAEAIDNLKNKVSASESNTKKAKDALDAAEAKYKDLKDKFDKMEADNKVAAEAAAKVANENATNKAKELVTNAVKVGKIKNEAKLIENWTKQAVENFDSTKDLLDSIAPSKPGAKVGEVVNKGTEGSEKELTMVIAKEMGAIRNRIEEKGR